MVDRELIIGQVIFLNGYVISVEDSQYDFKRDEQKHYGDDYHEHAGNKRLVSLSIFEIESRLQVTEREKLEESSDLFQTRVPFLSGISSARGSASNAYAFLKRFH